MKDFSNSLLTNPTSFKIALNIMSTILHESYNAS